jgi:VIT1/CCC1 family predicted Fe2+/Mn2+ transporter
MVTFGAFVVIGFVPLLSHVMPGWSVSAFPLSCAFTGTAMFTVGALRSLVIPRSWLKSGLEMLLVGSVAAAVAFAVGRITAGLIG